MLSNRDLARALGNLAALSGGLARAVDRNGDLPADQLAAGYVETTKLAERVGKLAGKLSGPDGRKGKGGGRR